MASIISILKGLRVGMWNFCFPENQQRAIRRQMEYVVRKERLEWSAYHSKEIGVTDEKIADVPVVLSLTTHGKRILTVHRIIEGIFLQSIKANKVVLYVGRDEYQSVEQLPVVLQRQCERGLTVCFVRDLRSYTKLLPALKEFPDSIIITLDDDVYYPVNIIERLLNAHKRFPTSVCSLVNRTMSLTSDGSIGEYNKFPFDTVAENDIQTFKIIPEGFGGVLYPPNSFTEEVFNEDVFMKLAPTADDLWFKAMELLAGTPVVKVHSFIDFLDEFIPDEEVQDIGLRNDNLYNEEKNNIQLKSLFEYYNLYQYCHD